MADGTTLSPLKYRAFALILASSFLSHLGNSVQAVGAAWQLTASGQPGHIVALVQSATNLPIMMLALLAGAFADMFDRRRVMLVAQCGMFTLSMALVSLSFAGLTPPALLIGITALLGCGVACFNPALAASISSAVPRLELAAAVALNILAFNLARSLGPALGGAIVAVGGARAAFLANACSYLAVIVTLLRWQVRQPPSCLQGGVGAVIASGVRFAFSSVEMRIIMIRALSFTMAGSAAWALMPIVSTELFQAGPSTFGMLLGSLGLGAVLGAASSTRLRNRFSSEAIVRGAGITYGVACMAVATRPPLILALVALVIAGTGWVQALSGFSVAGQLWSPRELVGRITALVSSLTFGGIALGSWFWGHFSDMHGVAATIMASGTAMVVLPLTGVIAPMPRHEAAAVK